MEGGREEGRKGREGGEEESGACLRPLFSLSPLP